MLFKKKIRVVNISPGGTEPYYECNGKGVDLYFSLNDKIEIAWKKKKYVRLVKLCHKSIKLYHKMLKHEKKACKLNAETYHPYHNNGYYRLIMYYENVLHDYNTALELAKEQESLGVNLQNVVPRLIKKLGLPE